MKKITVFILAMALVLPGCDDRLDFIADVNSSPLVALTRSGVNVAGTTIDFKIKDEVKGPGETLLPLDIFVDDKEGGSGTIALLITTGAGLLTNQDGAELVSPLNYENNSITRVYFNPNGNEGLAKIRVTVADNLGKQTVTEVSVNSFLNQAPVADWSYVNTKINDPYEYELDASSSYDPDETLGGGIAGYEWTINGLAFTVPLDKIPYVLSKANVGGTTYRIKLRILDNNGAYSTVNEKLITIN